MKKCQQCGNQFTDSYRFCPQCGSKDVVDMSVNAPENSSKIKPSLTDPLSDPMHNPVAYLQELQRQERVIDHRLEVERLHVMAEIHQKALQFFNNLRHEYEFNLEVDDTKYVGLAARLEPSLQEASSLLNKISSLPEKIRSDREMIAYVNRARSEVGFQTLQDIHSGFDQVFLSVKERIERPMKIMMAVLESLGKAVSWLFRGVYMLLVAIFKVVFMRK